MLKIQLLKQRMANKHLFIVNGVKKYTYKYKYHQLLNSEAENSKAVYWHCIESIEMERKHS